MQVHICCTLLYFTRLDNFLLPNIFYFQLMLFYEEIVVTYCRESSEGVPPPGMLTGQTARLFVLLSLITFEREITRLCPRLLYWQKNMKGHTSLMLA